MDAGGSLSGSSLARMCPRRRYASIKRITAYCLASGAPSEANGALRVGQFEALEEPAPGFIHRSGILTPTLVHGIEEGLVAGVRYAGTCHVGMRSCARGALGWLERSITGRRGCSPSVHRSCPGRFRIPPQVIACLFYCRRQSRGMDGFLGISLEFDPSRVLEGGTLHTGYRPFGSCTSDSKKTTSILTHLTRLPTLLEHF